LQEVAGFPHGNETPAMKEYQAKTVMDLGAQEACPVNSFKIHPSKKVTK